MATIKNVNAELKKVVGRVKEAQGELKAMIDNHDWIDEARKYAERQGKELKKLLGSDISKVKEFLERERKELERFQKQIPGEVKKLRQFVGDQRKELEKLIANVKKVTTQGASTAKRTAKPSSVKKPKKATPTQTQTQATASTLSTESSMNESDDSNPSSFQS